MSAKSLKCLSLWQPWASLIAARLKVYETRHWPTTYRGLLAIHAAKRPADKGWQNMVPIEDRPLLPNPLPLGAVVCVVKLLDCIPSEHLTRDPAFIRTNEFHYGNYSPGRYAWQLELVRVFQTPYPFKGQHGLFDWPLPPKDVAPMQTVWADMNVMPDKPPADLDTLIAAWQQAARDLPYAFECCVCGQPARQLIAYCGWLCDDCAERRALEIS